ncbi:MAG: hypothetical protein HC773_32200 [Scytonema sp. CRU_2_7]|nr:hypothetical protein [Scytonema sp. CRU_2_7]
MTNQIYPCLWFDGQAKAAADCQKPTPESPQIALQPSPSLNPQAELLPPDSLPPLPPLGSTQPIPTSSLPAAPLTAPNSTLTSKLPTLPNSSLSTSQTTASSNLPKGTLPSSGSALNIPQKANPTLPTNSQFGVPNSTGGQQIAIQPNPTLNRPGSVSPADLALPKKRELPPSLSPNRGSVSPNISTDAPPLPTIPNQTASSPKLDGEYNPASTTSSVRGNGNPLVEKLRNGRKLLLLPR